MTARRAGEVADVFIPPGWNENSAMTVGGVLLVFGLCSLLARGWIVTVGDVILDRREMIGRSGASRDAFPSGAWERQGGTTGSRRLGTTGGRQGDDRGRQGRGLVDIWNLV